MDELDLDTGWLLDTWLKNHDLVLRKEGETDDSVRLRIRTALALRVWRAAMPPVKLFVEITPHEGANIETEAVARLLTTMATKLWSEEFHLMQGPPQTRTVILAVDVVGVYGELVTAPCLPDESGMMSTREFRSIVDEAKGKMLASIGPDGAK